jgi:hypothetical protein
MLYGVFVVGPNQSGTNVNLVPPRYMTNFPAAVDAARGTVLGGLLRIDDQAEVSRCVSGGNTVIYRVKADGSERFAGPNPQADAREPWNGDVELRSKEMEMLANETIVPGGNALAERVEVTNRKTIQGDHKTLAELAGVAPERSGDGLGSVPAIVFRDEETMGRLLL